MHMTCSCGAGTKWTEQGPTSHNRYRVECVRCCKFVKWGSQQELVSMTESDAAPTIVTYEQHMDNQRASRGPTLDQFITD